MSQPIRRQLIVYPARIAVDLGELNATLESAFDAHLGAKALIARVRALKAREICRDCGGVGMRVSIQLGTPTPCPICRPEAFAEFFASLAPEEPEITHEQVDAEADARLADFRRRYPGAFGPHEQDYPQDDGDIQPFERTTSYPWGSK